LRLTSSVSLSRLLSHFFSELSCAARAKRWWQRQQQEESHFFSELSCAARLVVLIDH
jgi:hypothetical protein